MGQVFSNIWQKVFTGKKANIILVGLDAAGKTTLLYKMRLGQIMNSQNVFFYYETLENSKLSITCWDVGGCDRRNPFKQFYKNTQGIIFVVDSNDRDRIDQACFELETILKDDELSNAALLVFANKQDLSEAMTIAEIVEKLQLNKIQKRSWYAQGSCACNGEGLLEGFDWLSKIIHKQLE